MSLSSVPNEVAPCPSCKRTDRLVQKGMLCFVCETAAAREAANDVRLIEGYLGKHAAFHDWCVEHGLEE